MLRRKVIEVLQWWRGSMHGGSYSAMPRHPPSSQRCDLFNFMSSSFIFRVFAFVAPTPARSWRQPRWCDSPRHKANITGCHWLQQGVKHSISKPSGATVARSNTRVSENLLRSSVTTLGANPHEEPRHANCITASVVWLTALDDNDPALLFCAHQTMLGHAIMRPVKSVPLGTRYIT